MDDDATDEEEDDEDDEKVRAGSWSLRLGVCKDGRIDRTLAEHAMGDAEFLQPICFASSSAFCLAYRTAS